MEIISFLRETYWSNDYVVEVEGFKKVAKFVKEGLITSPFKMAVRKELLRNIQGLLLPEKIEFLDVPILIYDIPSYRPAELNLTEEANRFAQLLLSTLKNVLHIPRVQMYVLGLHDLVVSSEEPFLFVPMIDNLPPDYKSLLGRSLFVAPEYFKGQVHDKSTLYVFGKMLKAITDNESIRSLSSGMCQEAPSDRRFEETIPYLSIGGRKVLKVKRVRRDVEDEIINVALGTARKFIGVVGPQRSGKTTIIENIQTYLREHAIPFIHAVSGGDLIAQTLELTSEKIPSRLLDELSFCLDNTCRIETIALSIVEALKTLERVVIFVDDYQEADNGLRTLLVKLAQYGRESGLCVLAFSTDGFPEFEETVSIPPFSFAETERLVQNSVGAVGNSDLLSQWLLSVSQGLPGLMVSFLKKIYEGELLEYREGRMVFNPDVVERIDFDSILLEGIEDFLDTPDVYISVLGQKFTEAELNSLEAITGFRFRIDELLRRGVVYSEYNKFRFSLRQFWEIFYSKVPDDSRRKIHVALAQKTTEPERRAWHLEMAGNKNGATRTYLKAIYHALEYYYSPSYVKNLIDKVKKLIGGRPSYALIKFQIELAVRAEDKQLAESVEIPSGKLYSYLSARRAYTLEKSDEVHEIFQRFPDGYGKLGSIRRKLIKIANEYYFLQKRGDLYHAAKSLIGELNPKNPLHVPLIVEFYILLGNMVDNKLESTEYLRQAERLAIDFNVAHRLPTIYNNLSVNSASVQLAVQYLRRAVDVALQIGLPVRAYFAKINLLYFTLYSGKIKEFVEGMIEVKARIEMLGLSEEMRYCNVLEATYHAYNFELEEALGHLEEAAKLSASHQEAASSKLEKIMVYFITRDLEKVKQLVSEIGSDEEEKFSSEQKLVLGVLGSIGTDELADRWLEYANSSALLFREEILAILGKELAKVYPARVMEELKYLEKRFIVDGTFLSLALLYEGFGNYYKVLGNDYKARIYYRKSLNIYKDIGLLNAYEKLSQMLTESVGSSVLPMTSRNGFHTVYELVMSLKVADVRINPESILDYFASKISQMIPFTELSLAIMDTFLEKTFASTTWNRPESRGDYFLTSPLELSFTGRIDEYAEYHLFGSNPSISIPRERTGEVLNTLEVVDYAITTVFKSLLTTLRSYVDPLTKLYTRYYFSSVLEEQFKTIEQFGGTLTLVLCDIDNFKKINDTYGHLLGDSVLKAISKIFRENVRHTDVVGRFGGEEFILAFPHTEVEEAKFVLERLRRLLRELNEFPFTVTLSFGVSYFRKGLEKTIEELIIEADIALYQAKNTGKDRIVVYTEGMTGGLHA